MAHIKIFQKSYWSYNRTRKYAEFLIVVVTAVALTVLLLEARTTHHALCAFKANTQRQIKDSRDFLKDHPNGVLGISPETIQASIDRQDRVVRSLKSLHCGKITF